MTVSWVILTWNRADTVRRSVGYNLEHAGRRPDEIVWVDNGSTDGVREVMQSFRPDVTVLHHQNLGVAKGYNRGFLEASCDYVVITGCDTEMPDGWLTTFEQYLTAIPDTGVACIFCSDITQVPERRRGDPVTVNGLRIQPALPFGRRIIRRAFLTDEVGLLNEELGLYGWEDVLWGERALRVCQDKRLRTYCIPGQIAVHLGTEGNSEPVVLKDAAEYYHFKRHQVLDPQKQIVLNRIRDAGNPYYNPYRERAMQTNAELDTAYQTPDPWGFQTNPEDAKRKAKILQVLKPYGQFGQALDIGAGEGWITGDLPARKIYGFEASAVAAARFPAHVERTLTPEKLHCDLVTATGVLYAHYDWRRFLSVIRAAGTRIVLLCNIRDWEVAEVSELGTPVYTEAFSYREYTELIRVYDVAPKENDPAA